MKKLLTIGIFLISTLISNAQADTSTVEQYCQLIATPRLLSNKVTIDIDYGDEKSFWRDNRLKTDEGKIKPVGEVILNPDKSLITILGHIPQRLKSFHRKIPK